MVATSGDLLGELQREAWDLACAQPLGRARAREAWPRARRLVSSWGRLAVAADRALEAVPREAAAHSPAPTVTKVLKAWPHREEALTHQSDERLERMSELLGALADVYVAERERSTSMGNPHDSHSATDKVLVAVETAARMSRGFLGWTGTAKLRPEKQALDALITGSRAALRTRPPERSGRYDDVQIFTTQDGTLGAAISRWGRASESAMTDGGSGGLQRISMDAAVVLGATRHVLSMAGDHGLMPADALSHVQESLARAQQSWAAAARSFGASIRSLDRAPDELRSASGHLQSVLQATVRDGTSWRPIEDPKDVQALTSELIRAMGPVERVAWHYRDAVPRLVAAESFVVPARRLPPEDLANRPELLSERTAGRWVRLPRTTSSAQTLHESSMAVFGAVQSARQSADRLRQSGFTLTAPGSRDSIRAGAAQRREVGVDRAR